MLEEHLIGKASPIYHCAGGPRRTDDATDRDATAMIEAIALLLVYQLFGEALAFSLALPVPGPVIGMALLLATLALRPALLPRIKGTGTTLLSHLSLLFVPAGVGVMVHFARLSDEGVAIIAAVVGSTLLAIVATAVTAAWLIRVTDTRRAARSARRARAP